MSTIEQTSTTGPRPLTRLWRGRVPGPRLTLMVCLGLVAIGAGLVAAHVTVWALDETVFEQSAVHYTGNLPYSLLHDVNARATDRLYSLVLSLALRFFRTPTAIAINHVVSVLLFLSAAVPIYLLARRLLHSPWAAMGTALLSVVVPWLALTTALFSENLSYPLFWWAILAACYALWRPSTRRDALTLLAIGLLVITRIQFLGILAGYICAIVVVTLLRCGLASPRPGLAIVRKAARTHVLLIALLAAGVATVVYLKASGHWGSDVTQGLGTYSNVVIRSGLPANMVEGLVVELLALGIGVGLLPAIVSLAWFARRIVAPSLEEAYIFLVGTAVIVAVFLVLTVFSQGGYLGPITEERYFFYVVPVFWLGTFAALRRGTISPGHLALCAVAIAALYGSVPFESPLTAETAFLAPAESTVQHVLSTHLGSLVPGLSPQDALAVLAVLAGASVALIWTRGRPTRWRWTLGLAIALQFTITGYTYAVLTGNVTGIPGRTGDDLSALGWVDSNTRTGHVAWLANSSTSAPPGITGEDQARTTLFFNKTLTTWITVPQTGVPAPIFPMSALPGHSVVQVNARSGVLESQPPLRGPLEVVGETASPFLQLAGPTIARSPGGGLAMTSLAHPIRATWLATGLGSDGSVLVGAPADLSAFAYDSGSATLMRVTFQFMPPPGPSAPANQHSALVLSLGSAVRTVRLAAGATAPTIVSVAVCAAPGQHVVTGRLRAVPGPTVANHAAGGVLEHVIARSRPSRSCSP